MKKLVAAVAFTAALLIPIFGQAKNIEKSARELREFERDLITASMNHDRNWLERFFAGDLFVVPQSPLELIKIRPKSISQMIESKIPVTELTPRNLKVRITGNVNVITDSSSQSRGENSTSNNVIRTFSFLDTFNKKNGKWQLIASNFSPLQTETEKNVEQTIIRLEQEWRAAAAKKDFDSINRIVADDFVGIESDGTVLNKAQIISEIAADANSFQAEGFENLKIKVYGQTAVVTGQLSNKESKNGAIRIAKTFFTDIWAKQEDQWRIISHQTTRLR